MQKVGFQLDTTQRKWFLVDAIHPNERFDFLKYAGWIQAIVKEFGKHLLLRISPIPKLPWGSTFKAYQRCLLLQGSPRDFANIDMAFRRAGVANVKKVKSSVGKWSFLIAMLIYRRVSQNVGLHKQQDPRKMDISPRTCCNLWYMIRIRIWINCIITASCRYFMMVCEGTKENHPQMAVW
jgi:hypothetical protein